jgi:hypothetical protein
LSLIFDIVVVIIIFVVIIIIIIIVIVIIIVIFIVVVVVIIIITLFVIVIIRLFICLFLCWKLWFSMLMCLVFARFTPSGNAEQDYINLLMASPLFKQINDLEELLNKSADDASTQALASDMVQGET